MTDRFVANHATFTVPLGYSIMENGDIVTTTGEPVGSFDEEYWLQRFGKLPTFRKATPEEAASLNGHSAAFADFTERLK